MLLGPRISTGRRGVGVIGIWVWRIRLLGLLSLWRARWAKWTRRATGAIKLLLLISLLLL